MARPQPDFVQVAEIIGAHGIRGALKIRCMIDDPEALPDLNPMLDCYGNRLFDLARTGSSRGNLVAIATGIADRNQAKALHGVGLYVPRDRLPVPDDDEFFATDLVGLTAVDPKGHALGSVKAVFDFGAGDIIELERGSEDSIMLPFTKDICPDVDIEAGTLTVDMPDDLTN
ncbi:MAG: ribosome maturation factor RimM [Pseudomonadota bacterium]